MTFWGKEFTSEHLYLLVLISSVLLRYKSESNAQPLKLIFLRFDCRFQRNLVDYQSLITRSVYDKQLDSGRGTLLHLCDEVIQQEVKEVIISFFILMEQGKATSKEDLDQQCERLLKEEFGESCNFDVDDAVQKLEKLGIVIQERTGMYTCVDLKQANEIIGTTTEEVVLRVKQGGKMKRQASESASKSFKEKKEDYIQYADDEFDNLLL